MTKTVLISGAGIAGLTTAYWLHRHGFTPTVVERAADVRDGGYKIDIRGAALTVLERMGVLDAIRARKTDIRSGSVVDARGRRVAAMDGDTFGGRVHGDAEILRGDLARILYDLTKDEVEYRFEDSIADLTDADDGVKVTFAGGAVQSFDLVIGADGLHSATRTLTFGPGFEHDLGYRVAVYSTPNTLDLDREELTYVGPGRTALTYNTTGDDEAKAMFLFASTADTRDPGAAQRVLAEAYAGEGWAVPQLLAAMPEAPDFYCDSLSQVHLDTWSRGRVCLVGDAAHAASAASGQGTSLALVGAYVLAGELATANGDVSGFHAYEHELREFVAQNQKLGPANVKRMVLRSQAQVRMSMAMLGLLNRLPGKDKLMAKVVESIHRAATAIDLKTY
ncbi:FAD-dependent monooxygenase [Labedaea rhizosphaerae]|uniref:2-polyprenyl-6-methoxyphenol hydroxylase-like FAD-dependent oxidoreductase n=1 Tax=Labedaea rhizosphaerae TaxID=598644 RepID=A0A4R6RVS5_LABRH|nr:FAD-dependent monooxygenase [Labedaea rhizosphaerae]TDP91102.1 2-polyprenyl-6-methoxyphenol hydroxylase-like FAD-dependent oxidoreductase [Labedaea rhizosphaerae]